MNKIFMYHLVLLGFFSNADAMGVKSLVGLSAYRCEFKGQPVFTGDPVKKEGTIAFMSSVPASQKRSNIDQISYDMQNNEATLKFNGLSVVLKDDSLDGLMDCLSDSSHYSQASIRTTIENKPLNWQFSRGQDARNAAALYSVNKCRQSLGWVTGAHSDRKIQDVNVVKNSNVGTGTLSLTSSPYLPGSRLRLTNDKNDKQSVLIHWDFVQLLYNVCKATTKYNEEKESSTEAKQILVKALFPSSSPRDIIQQPNDTEQVTLQLLEKDLPVMEQWLYAQKVKWYVSRLTLLLAAIGVYFYSTSNAQ